MKPIPDIKVGDQISLSTQWGDRKAEIIKWAWPHLTINPVSVMVDYGDGKKHVATFSCMSSFLDAYTGKSTE